MSTSSAVPVIVAFEESTTQAQIDAFVNEINSNGGRVKMRYDPFMKSFAADITPNVLTKLQSFTGNGIIKYIEPDGIVTTQ